MVIPIITVLQGDMGTALLTMTISGVMLLFGPIPFKDTLKCVGGVLLVGIVGIACFIVITQGKVLNNVQASRLTTFTQPCKKYEETGYHICNCLIAINNGGLTGLGIGKSRQKYSYIPEAHTDSIFSIIVEEFGLVAGLAILACYFLLIARLILLSERTRNPRNKYILLGIAIYTFIHIVLNIGGLMAVLPLTGVPLPLISYGGSFTISYIAAIALALRIAAENNLKG